MSTLTLVVTYEQYEIENSYLACILTYGALSGNTKVNELVTFTMTFMLKIVLKYLLVTFSPKQPISFICTLICVLCILFLPDYMTVRGLTWNFQVFWSSYRRRLNRLQHADCVSYHKFAVTSTRTPAMIMSN